MILFTVCLSAGLRWMLLMVDAAALGPFTKQAHGHGVDEKLSVFSWLRTAGAGGISIYKTQKFGKKMLPSRVFFQAENAQQPFSACVLPKTLLVEFTTSPKTPSRLGSKHHLSLSSQTFLPVSLSGVKISVPRPTSPRFWPPIQISRHSLIIQ